MLRLVILTKNNGATHVSMWRVISNKNNLFAPMKSIVAATIRS